MNNYFVEIYGKDESLTSDVTNETSKAFLASHMIINKYHIKLPIGDRTLNVTINSKNNGEYILLVDGVYIDLKFRTALQKYAEELMEKTASTHHHRIIKSPMPGMVLKVKFKEGDKIKTGDSVMILEAMKMENEIKSPADGTIKKIFANEGSAVEKNAQLFELE